MLKKWPILVMTLAMAGVANAAITPATPETDTDGCYLISDAAELYGFAAIVNGTLVEGHGAELTACGKLTENIVVNENVLTSAGELNIASAGGFIEWTPIGNSTNKFQGAFNGQGHTISGLYFNNPETDNVGLFGYTFGAVTIDNVGVVDSYFRGGQNVGSIVGQAASDGTKELTVTKSYNKGFVTGTGNVGGLVGKNGNVKFSYNTGSVTGTSNVGGLVGSNTNSFEINGSYNVGLVKNGAGSGNAVLGSCPTDAQYNVVKNIYHLEGSGDKCPGAFSMTSYEFADGFVAIMLHNDRTVTGADVWGQVVGTDKTPTLTGEIVFPISLDNSDNCYVISSAEDLYVFAAIVNSGFKSDACGKLTENIVVNENVLTSAGELNTAPVGGFKEWTPIGFGTNSFGQDISFRGTFHGQGHTISGLYFNDTETEDVGLFGDVYGTVVIDSVGLVDSYINAKGYVGGIVGFARGSLTISDSYNASSVNTPGSGFGGLVGAAGGIYDEEELIEHGLLTISNSYNEGSLNGNKWGGGLVGYADVLDVSNSYNAGPVYISGEDISDEEAYAYVGGITSSVDNASTVTNSYNYGAISYPTGNSVSKDDLVAGGGGGDVAVTNCYFIGESEFKDNGATKMTAENFADGTVFAQLHSATDGEVWKQYQGDAYPSFAAKSGTGAPAPMHVATLQYPDAEHEGQYKTEYVAFVEGVAKKLPVLDKNGNPLLGWSESGNNQPILTEIPVTKTEGVVLFPKSYDPAADGCYEIADAYQLYVFAAVVNDAGKKEACARLTADITVNSNVLNSDGSLNSSAASDFRTWTPILNFGGTFDGQGHVISGLYVTGNSTNVGLFGSVGGDGSNVTIKNVGIEDSYFAGDQNVGGLVGNVNASTASLNIENCYNAGAVNAGSLSGGLVGNSTNTVNIENSYNIGKVYSTTTSGALVGSGKPNIVNSYYLEGVSSTGCGDGTSCGTAKTAEQFAGTAADGNVLAALQSNADGYIWTQGVKYPKFGTYEPVNGCYEIATASQLYWFAAIVNNGNGNACGKLTADIVVNENVLATAGGVSNVNATTGAYIGNNASSFIEWTPIGNNGHPFQGKFDGQGHSVSGLYFNGENVYDVGLFGRVAGDTDGASVENVEVADSYFGNSGETGDHVGGVVGMVTHGGVVNVKNVSSAAVVVGNEDVGGVVGYVLGTEGDLKLNIANAYNVGMVKGSDDVGGLVGKVTNDRVENKIAINNSYNYGDVSFKMNGGGAPLIGKVVNTGSVASIAVGNSYYLANESSGSYGEYKTATEFADGTVLSKLREQSRVWVQNPGDKYPTIDINASADAVTIVLDWTSAADSVKLSDWIAKYGEGVDVDIVVKSGKQFYADGAIYEGTLTDAQVAAIGSNKLYPISGVELETVDGKLVATLNGDSQVAVMIPTNVQVDIVIYKRNITAGAYTTVMLPFDVDVVNNMSVNGKYTFYKFCGVDSDAEGTIINVAPVTTKFKANRPYIMIANADNSEGITFEKVGDSKYTLNTTTSSTDATAGNWTMRGVYEYKVWPKGDDDLGYVYGFANKAGSGNQIGEFVEAGAGADIVPMRMYLKETVPQGVRGNGRYNYSSHTGPAKVVRVQIVEGDGDDETTAIKHVATVPTVVKSNRWFDVKGRALNGKPTAKGTYYYNGQRVIIK